MPKVAICEGVITESPLSCSTGFQFVEFQQVTSAETMALIESGSLSTADISIAFAAGFSIFFVFGVIKDARNEIASFIKSI